MNFIKQYHRSSAFAHRLVLISQCSLLIAFVSCQPRANYITIAQPMNSFSENLSDSARGAKSIQDLGCYFFLALKGDIRFDQLARFIPDSSDIKNIYVQTSTSLTDVSFKSLATTIHNQEQTNFYSAVTEAQQLNASWLNATFEKLMVEEIEDQKLPSKKIILECKSGTVTLRASAKCMEIGDRWFIGEGIKFGV